jgi:hypothetical protein
MKTTPEKLFKSIDHRLNAGAKEKHTGFALLVFPFHADGKTPVSYMANCDKEALRIVIKTMMDQLTREGMN